MNISNEIRKRINILFKNKNYEIEVNNLHSIHHVISDLFNNIIKKDLYIYEKFYYAYLIENKDYFLKVIKSKKIKNEKIENKDVHTNYLNPNCNIGLHNNYELFIHFDIIILLTIIMEYNEFIIKNIMLTHIIIQYILLKICNYYLHINIHNITFEYFTNITLKMLSISLIIFTIIWIILLYIIFIKNNNKR